MTDTPDPREEQLDDGEPQPTAPVIEPAPEWLVAFRRSDFPRGSYTSGPGFGVVFTDRGDDVLVVSWDNLSSAREDTIDRTPWGYSFVAKNGWSQLGVMTFNADWFRNDDLIAHLVSLRDSGFFRRFRQVVMTGTSMGAYAATAFASLAPGCTVVAFSPQSTLKKDLVPWETRFSSGRRADWSGPFADGAVESLAASKVLLIYDPQFQPDVQHIERYHGANAVRLQARYSGHKTALFLRRAGLLSSVVRAAVSDTLTEAEFYRLYRGGRVLPWYLHAVMARLIEGGRQRHLPRFAKAVRAMGNEPLARAALVRAAEAGVIKQPRNPRNAPGSQTAQGARTPRPAAPAERQAGGGPRMGPHQRRQAERAANRAARTAQPAEEPSEPADLYQTDPQLPPLTPAGALPWQQMADARRSGRWRESKREAYHDK